MLRLVANINAGDEISLPENLTFRIYNNNSLYHSVGSAISDNNVTILGTEVTIVNIPSTAGVTYNISITAVDEAGNEQGTKSNVVTITTSDTEAPSKPILTYTNVQQTSVQISATSTDNVAVVSFDIYSNSILKETVPGSLLTNYTVSGLIAGTLYNLYVIAKDTVGNLSPSSNIITFTTTDVVNITPTYYVSFSSGNDSNDGRTQQTAWKTIGKVNSAALVAGDVIGFKKGDTFTDNWLYILNKVGTSSNRIVFTSYGTGNKPIIDVTRTYTGSWTNTATNVWRSAVWTTFAEDVTRLMVDGVNIQTSWIQAELGTNISLSGTDPNGFVGAWLDQTNKYIYLYSTTNPTSKVVKHNGLSRAFLLRGLSYITFHDLEIKGGYFTGITNDGNKYITFDGCTIGKMCAVGITTAKYNLIRAEGTIIKNCTFDTGWNFDYRNCTRNNSNAEHKGSSDAIRFYDGLTGEIYNNTILNWDHTSISLTASNNGVDEISGLKVYNNYCSIIDGMPYGGGFTTDRLAHNNEIYNNTFYKTKANQVNGYSNHFHHNLVQTKHPVNYDYAEGYGIDFNPYAGPCHDNRIENNVFYECGSGAIRFKQNAGVAQNYNHIVINNIMYNCGRNNTSLPNVAIEYNYGTSIHDNTVNNNSIYHSAKTNIIYDADTTTYRTVAQFNTWTKYGTSINNIATNPLFVSDGSDYHLQDTSTCINAGITPLSTIDLDGNSIPYPSTAPDIGAYEYGYGTTPIVNKPAKPTITNIVSNPNKPIITNIV